MEGLIMEVEQKQSIAGLLDSGIVQLGRNASDNPENLDFPAFALGVANKDYPAQTPRLWNAVYEALGMPQRSIRLFGDSKDLETIFAAFKTDTRYIGGDVGVGFKDKAWRIVDELDPIARAMESINVVVRTAEGKLKGYNTDGLGYAESLETVLQKKGKELKGAKVVVLGGGGTTNAITFSLAAKGAGVVILNRTVPKAEALAERINWYFAKALAKAGGRELIKEELKDAVAVVSVIDDPDSPLYLYSALGRITLPPSDENIAANLAAARAIMQAMARDAVISDVMLRNEDTATIWEAKAAGFTTLDGRPMVLNQAIEAFWLVNQPGLENLGVTKEKVEEIIRGTTGE